MLLFSDQPNVSGLQDFDYPSLIDARVSMDILPELSDVKRVPLPPELVEQFGRILFCQVIELHHMAVIA